MLSLPELKPTKIYGVRLPNGNIIEATTEVATELSKRFGKECLIAKYPAVKISWNGASYVLRLPYNDMSEVEPLLT